MSDRLPFTGDLVMYQTDDGKNRIECRLTGETIWLSQALMAELFNRSRQTISEHLQNLFTEGEIDETAVVRNFRTTAVELVLARSDANEPSMALTSWSGSRVRKQDVIVAQNYLSAEEIDSLNRLVVIFLKQAELRVKERKQLSLEFWRGNVDRLLEFNDRKILEGPGSVSHEAMKTIALGRYEEFDALRRSEEALQSDRDELAQLEELEKQIAKKEGLQ